MKPLILSTLPCAFQESILPLSAHGQSLGFRIRVWGLWGLGIVVFGDIRATVKRSWTLDSGHRGVPFVVWYSPECSPQ